MGQVITAIISLSKTLAIVDQWIRALVEAYTTEQIKDIQGRHDNYTKQRMAITLAIGQATTPEQKAQLFAALNNLRR